MINFGFFSDMCEPGWNHSCDALIILGFLFSLLAIILVPTVPFIYTPLRGWVLVCCNKCEIITNTVAIIMIVILIMCEVSSTLKSSNLILYSLSTMFWSWMSLLFVIFICNRNEISADILWCVTETLIIWWKYHLIPFKCILLLSIVQSCRYCPESHKSSPTGFCMLNREKAW